MRCVTISTAGATDRIPIDIDRDTVLVGVWTASLVSGVLVTTDPQMTWADWTTASADQVTDTFLGFSMPGYFLEFVSAFPLSGGSRIFGCTSSNNRFNLLFEDTTT